MSMDKKGKDVWGTWCTSFTSDRICFFLYSKSFYLIIFKQVIAVFPHALMVDKPRLYLTYIEELKIKLKLEIQSNVLQGIRAETIITRAHR